jgi:hypothetical protein
MGTRNLCQNKKRLLLKSPNSKASCRTSPNLMFSSTKIKKNFTLRTNSHSNPISKSTKPPQTKTKTKISSTSNLSSKDQLKESSKFTSLTAKENVFSGAKTSLLQTMISAFTIKASLLES